MNTSKDVPMAHHSGIAVEQHGRVLVARIDGGPRGEFDRKIASDLDALVTQATEDDSCSAVVLTSTHPSRFIAHADINWLRELGAANPPVGARAAGAVLRAAGAGRRAPGLRRVVERSPLNDAAEYLALHDTLLRMNASGAVFVAAINGSALGLGSELAVACDYRIMASGEHLIGQPEILLGFPPGAGGTQRLSRLIGNRHAVPLMLEGGALSPEAAAQIGYIDEVVEPDVLMERAIEYAERLARRVKRAVEAVKRSAYIGGSMTLEHGLHLERAEFLSCIGQPGAQEAMGAYIAQSDASGDLPAYDNHTYLRMREGGSLQ